MYQLNCFRRVDRFFAVAAPDCFDSDARAFISSGYLYLNIPFFNQSEVTTTFSKNQTIMKREFTVVGICMVLMFAVQAYLKPGFWANTVVVILCAATMWALISAIFKDDRDA